MRYKNLNSIIKKFILIVFLYGLTSASFNGFFGIYLKELGYAERVVGSILSLRRLSVGISTLIIAMITNKIGHKRTLILGLFTVGLSSISIVLVENIQVMKVIALVFGFGQSAMMTVESPFIYEQTQPEERVHAFSLTFAIRNAAFVTGSLFTGVLADYFSKIIGPGSVSIRYALVIVSAMRAMINNLMRALGIFLGGYIMESYTYNTPYIFTILFYLIGTYIFFKLFREKIIKKPSISS